MQEFARKQGLVACLLAIACLAGRLALLPVIPIPEPAIQDEFSNLLAADTFASGRLTNPTHPLWRHFETIHELMRPTYQSKYPPLQGMVLALGQVVFGHPWFGVWLSMGLMMAALYWALAGWLPPKWALLGGLLALPQVGFLNYWSESYWGGAVAAAAGALLIGAVPRLRRKATPGMAMVFAAAVALLANSRPYEGFVLTVACSAYLMATIQVRRILLPCVLVLVPAAGFVLYDNQRVTGSPWVLPYQAHEKQYAASSAFIWDTHARPEPHYNHPAIKAAYIDWELSVRQQQLAHPWRHFFTDLRALTFFFPGPLLGLAAAIFLIPVALRQPKMRVPLGLALFFLLGLEMETFILPHYAAPGTAFVFILCTAALRRMRRLLPGTTVALLCAIAFLDMAVLAEPHHRALFDKSDLIAHRRQVLGQLDRVAGQQLVLVEFGEGHDINHEWVYNRADIDRARIVWARDLGAEKNQEILDYYPERNVWHLLDRGPRGVVLARLRAGVANSGKLPTERTRSSRIP